MTKDEVLQQLSELQEKIKKLPDGLDFRSAEVYKFRTIDWKSSPYLNCVYLQDCIEKAADDADVAELHVDSCPDKITLTFTKNGLTVLQETRRSEVERKRWMKKWE